MASGIKAYPFDEIEPRWQKYWEEHQTFLTPDTSSKPKYYVLDMFPYPSAAGLHVGHLEGYTATDIIARYKRMKGFNVLHPMGWDAFGLPAEQHAIETGTHPRQATAKNVANFKRQIKRLGFSYDWEREVNTTDEEYYRWTQWIFMKLFEKGLAYEAHMPVNFCPALGTVLANEEVIDGKSERGGHPVIRKTMRQWVLKITAYAERLLEDLEDVNWPDAIKEQQRNWIGKSTGAEVDFALACHSERSEESASSQILRQKAPQDDKKEMQGQETIRVFTTRPDTLFGATYMVLAPEHPLVSRIVGPAQQLAVEEYIKAASRKSDLDRTDLAKEKTGVFTGACAVNPVNQKKIPIWIADYVLASYGTGAIMAVPAHDERDFEFAKKFDLPIVQVIQNVGAALGGRPHDAMDSDKGRPHRGAPTIDAAFTGVGVCVNSKSPDGSFSIDGMLSDKAKEKITEWLEQKGIGKKSVQYKLRDWLFSRQRYWGEPIPVIHVDGKPRLVGYDELPVRLPELSNFKPTGTGESPLALAEDWLNIKMVKMVPGTEGTGNMLPVPSVPGTIAIAKRETNTMPQWAGSCWYYLRYLDPKNNQAAVAPEKEKYWLPVDLYVGGAEHAVLHLLYSRFWHKVLYDCGVVTQKEPFYKLVNQGMILGSDNQKMSKSRGNVINPDEMVDRYGADSIRLYEMFMGPLEMTKPWADQGVEGVYRFLGRVWRLFIDKDGNLHRNIIDMAPRENQLQILHRTIKKVTEDIENIRLNTAISALMIFVNEMVNETDHCKSVMEKFLLLLAPYAPHMAEELWLRLGHPQTLACEPWPVYDPRHLEVQEFEMAVMIGGKVRAKITVSKEMSPEQIQALALGDAKVQPWIQGKEIKKVIVVPGRTVNIVA